MDKVLSDGTIAEIGLNVKVTKSADGFKVGDETMITSINDIVINKSKHEIDLSKWKYVVRVSGGWMVNINNIKISQKINKQLKNNC
jgi:hypothetical protein